MKSSKTKVAGYTWWIGGTIGLIIGLTNADAIYNTYGKMGLTGLVTGICLGWLLGFIYDNATSTTVTSNQYHKPIIIKDETESVKNSPPSREIEKEHPKPSSAKAPVKSYTEEVKTIENPKQVIKQDKPKEVLSNDYIEVKQAAQEILFVNYNSDLNESISNYPLFRLPKYKCVIRSHRIGSFKRRGYKEESFQKSIEKFFSQDFIVSGNVRLNTGKDTRPYEPDIALIDKKTNQNIRIDIEIDEPYAGFSRQATHCAGDDLLRDNYFIDRGWIVIRFSEHQVHTQEIQCLNFISNIVKSINSDFTVPNEFKTVNQIKNEPFWDIIQSQKWEKEKYREKYLSHIFQETIEPGGSYKRGFNDQEIKEEALVKSTLPTSIGKIEQDINPLIDEPTDRDKRIKFYPEAHIYTIDNVAAPSVSEIISKFFPEFDPDSAIDKMRDTHPLSSWPREKIKSYWESKAKEARDKGTFLHKQIENYYLGKEYTKTEEFYQFINFVNDHSHIEPYRLEWRIFDKEYQIAGTIDLVAKNGNGFDIYDWKRSNKVVNTNGYPITTNQWQCGIGQLAHIDDTSFNRYSLQQSLYRYILENNYELVINKMYLIVLCPENTKYNKVEAPYLKKEVQHILKSL